MIASFALAVLTAAAPPALTLPELVAKAAEHDPRHGQPALEDAASALRQANFEARFLPAFTVLGDATYHSDVVEARGLSPAKDQYSLTVGTEQLLFDGGRTHAEAGIETASRELAKRRVATREFALRQRVEAAYFDALGASAELALIATLTTDLETQLHRVEAQVAGGVALPGNAAVLAAELAGERQRAVEVAAARRGSLDALEQLTGMAIPDQAELALPEPAAPEAALAAARAAAEGEGVARPELEELAGQKQVLERQLALATLPKRPRVTAFLDLGAGRPADQNFAAQDVEPFYRFGLRLRWMPWDWGTAEREGEVLALAQQSVELERQSFLEGLSANLAQLARQIEALASVVAGDAEIVALRERAARQAEAQLREGVITPSDYLTEKNAEHRARLLGEQHRLMLVRARQELSTALGGQP
ncbi:MAG: TolC family protein [Thermoanaerobaculia bacterium]